MTDWFCKITDWLCQLTAWLCEMTAWLCELTGWWCEFSDVGPRRFRDVGAQRRQRRKRGMCHRGYFYINEPQLTLMNLN
jgi:hypothetical protein